MEGRNNKIGSIILLFFITIFSVIIISIFSKEINKNNKYVKDFSEYHTDYQFDDVPVELKNLSFEDKKLLCEDLEQNPLDSDVDTKRLHDACLFMINFDVYDERLCSLMYGVIEDTIYVGDIVSEFSYKQHCYAKVAIQKGDIGYCKGQGEPCISLAEQMILNSGGDVVCEKLLPTEAKYCKTQKINSKYGVLLLNYYKNSYDNLDPEVYEYIEQNSIYRFNKFGTVENLCNSFVSDLKDESEIGTNELYNRCVNGYMENMNQKNVEHCRKLKYSEIESKNGIALTEKDYCLSRNIIDKTKNIKDCQFADYSNICISIVAHELGNKTNCDVLSSKINRELCYDISGKKAPTIKLDSNHKCLIKGNISYKTQEKIYHMPGCSHYNDTKIDTNYGEEWFCSEQEARNAGWRKCKEY